MLVAFEGIDGSGKSTLIRLVTKELKARGESVMPTQEPTQGWLGKAVRRGIRSNLDPVAMAALFLADRAAHLTDLRPALERGDLVLTDRYIDSTTAYQVVSLRGLLPRPFESLRQLQARLFPPPDLVIWLDLSPERAITRLAARRVREPFEKVRFLRDVRANYMRLAALEAKKWVRLDATKPPAELATLTVAAILERAPRRRPTTEAAAKAT